MLNLTMTNTFMCILGCAQNPFFIQLPTPMYKCMTEHVRCRPLVDIREKKHNSCVSQS